MSADQTADPQIKVGQVWRDVDKRRAASGTIRTFTIESVGEVYVTARTVAKIYWLNRRRFGNGRKNDSFELVSETEHD